MNKSKSSSITVETIRRIYNDTEGVFIEVGPDPDAIGMVSIATTTRPSELYFGSGRYTFTAEYARSLAVALLSAATEADAFNKENNNVTTY